jgi:hypothetical protein
MSINPTPSNPSPSPAVRIAPEVAALLGPAMITEVTEPPWPLAYRCAACGEPGTATAMTPAAVLVLLDPAQDGPTVVRYAHGWCAPSGIVPTDTYTANPEATRLLLPARTWLRPTGDDPAAVLLLAPRIRPMRLTDGGDLQDSILAGLLGQGFTLLTHPDQTIPRTDQLTGLLGPHGRVVITDQHGDTFYDGTTNSPTHAEWARRIRGSGVLGLVLAAGLDLHDPDRDQDADLRQAISAGHAIAATIPIHTLAATAPPTSGRADPGRHR